MNKLRKGDQVIVISGRDKGKSGVVLRRIDPDHLVVEGINIVKKHSRAKGAARQAGMIELEVPVHVSNVMLLCNKCNHPTRVDFRSLEDGRRVRVCRSCHEVID